MQCTSSATSLARGIAPVCSAAIAVPTPRRPSPDNAFVRGAVRWNSNAGH